MPQVLLLSGVPRIIIDLIRRPEGCTMIDLMRETGWQPHSIRSCISTMRKQYGVQIEFANIPGIGRAYKHWDKK